MFILVPGETAGFYYQSTLAWRQCLSPSFRMQGEKKELIKAIAYGSSLARGHKRAVPWTPLVPGNPSSPDLLHPWLSALWLSCDDSWSLLTLTSLGGFKQKDLTFSFKSQLNPEADSA